MGLVVTISITGHTQLLRRAGGFIGQLWIINDNCFGFTTSLTFFYRSVNGKIYLGTPSHCKDHVATKWEPPLQFFFSAFKYYFVHESCFFSPTQMQSPANICDILNVLKCSVVNKNITTMTMWTVQEETCRFLSLFADRKKSFNRWFIEHDTLSTPICQNY